MITIYGTKTCGYCVELKTILTNENIEFIDKDINALENKEEYAKIEAKTKSEYIPIIIVDKNILVPQTSFKTINEAVNIIKILVNK